LVQRNIIIITTTTLSCRTRTLTWPRGCDGFITTGHVYTEVYVLKRARQKDQASGRVDLPDEDSKDLLDGITVQYTSGSASFTCRNAAVLLATRLASTGPRGAGKRAQCSSEACGRPAKLASAAISKSVARIGGATL